MGCKVIRQGIKQGMVLLGATSNGAHLNRGGFSNGYKLQTPLTWCFVTSVPIAKPMKLN